MVENGRFSRALNEARAKWQYRGEHRPEFADPVPQGCESVWDYPRPPAIVEDSRVVTVSWRDTLIARSNCCLRVLETASPPTFYLPEHDVVKGFLEPGQGASFCEWKGAAQYLDVVIEGERLSGVAWGYPQPLPGMQRLAGYLAFYPGQAADELHCEVDGEPVLPQPGGLYGGWITAELCGPWKGGPGTSHW